MRHLDNGPRGTEHARFAMRGTIVSMSITSDHVDSIVAQSIFMTTCEKAQKELKRHHQALKRVRAKEKMKTIDATLPPDLLRSVNQARNKGSSSWLNAMPLVDQVLALNRQEFRVSLRMRYNLPLVNLPSQWNLYIQPQLQLLDNETTIWDDYLLLC